MIWLGGDIDPILSAVQLESLQEATVSKIIYDKVR